jgi:hypothetical protein
MHVYVGATDVLAAPEQVEQGPGVIAVGADIDFGAPVAFFIGAIDDVRVWNTALSAGDVAAELAR